MAGDLTRALSRALWRKSTRSSANGACVEVAGNLRGMVAVRDSMNPTGPVLYCAAAAWRSFAGTVGDHRDEGVPSALPAYRDDGAH